MGNVDINSIQIDIIIELLPLFVERKMVSD